MHLKSLTLKGFKSFASATTLRFEPGITAVVGPNGSGKSNVVDAIAWVLGEQGAKALRGGKMEDVIFAGTAGRPPLGRAEVTLTIDNTDGALPIDYTEVSITRRMFREGSSEYEINGESARLLDIQELLSDSGIGREMHVIVGQGQLDAVLQARPEDRRGFIEEAAGVLKHRKRKEKALRKLDAMQANLTRLTDLTAELRRQLKPLGPAGRDRPAGRRRAGRAARLPAAAAGRRPHHAAHRARARGRRRGGDPRPPGRGRGRAGRRPRPRDRAGDRAGRRRAAARPRPGDLVPPVRARGAVPRHRDAGRRARPAPRRAEPDDVRTGRDPEELEAEAAEVARAGGHAARPSSSTPRAELTEAVAERQSLERRLADAERALVAAARAVADRREGLAKLAGQVNALRTRAVAGRDEIARLAAAAEDARSRAAAAEAELDRVQGEVGALDEGELGLDTRHEARGRRATRPSRPASASWSRPSGRPSASARPGPPARDALAVGLTRKDGAAALLATPTAPGRARLGGRAAHRRARLRGRARRRPRAGRRRGRRRLVRHAADALAHLRATDAGRAGAGRSAT